MSASSSNSSEPALCKPRSWVNAGKAGSQGYICLPAGFRSMEASGTGLGTDAGCVGDAMVMWGTPGRYSASATASDPPRAPRPVAYSIGSRLAHSSHLLLPIHNARPCPPRQFRSSSPPSPLSLRSGSVKVRITLH